MSVAIVAGRRIAPAVSANTPSAPLNVTSITKDAGATISFYAPASQGGSSITHYVVTPLIGGSPQSATTVPVGSLTSLADSAGGTALQAAVTSLTNSTAYTFTVRARNSYGDGPESVASGANTPLSGLVFGDDFNGPAGGPIDPEWWVYNRCGYLAQNEIQYYLPDHCVLDGSGNLQLIGEHTSYTGPKYASAGGGSVTQAWRSGACQSNAKTWTPAAGNTMTFEARMQICPGIAGGMWPGLFWLEGQDFKDAWKTDPQQTGWDNAGKAEIDIAEFNPTQVFDPTDYLNNSYATTQTFTPINTAVDFSAGMHTFSVQWKPGVSNTFIRDGSQTHQDTGSSIASSSCQYFLLLYLQILAGSASSPQNCYIDYVRVYDQNLG